MIPSAPTPDLEELATYLSQRTGISFRGARGPWLRDVLRTLDQWGGATMQPRQLDSDEQAFLDLCNRVTVQESFFFREPAKLEILRTHVVPELTRSAGEVRVWSAGCARGEEAYTLSMLLRWAGLAGRYRIVGTDLSPAAVEQAACGSYGRWALRGVDPASLEKGFLPCEVGYRVRDEFREAVSFHRHNLLEPLPVAAAPFHVVFCRNVLIYFSPTAVQRVAAALTAALIPGGWLITSSSDPILENVPGLEPVMTEHGLAYRRLRSSDESAQPAPRQLAHQPVSPAARRTGPATPRRSERQEQAVAAVVQPADVLNEARRALELARPQDAQRLGAELLRRADEGAGHRIIAEALAQDGRLPEAVEAAARAAGATPDDAEAHHLHAMMLLECDRVTEARAAARRALYLDPELALAHLVLARVHERLGDHRAARRARRNGRRLLQEVQRDVG